MSSSELVSTVAVNDTEELEGLKSANSGARKTLEGIDAGLSLFSPTLTENSVVREVIVDYHPLSSLTKRKAVDFHISSANNLYFDWSRSVLRVKVKITKNDGNNIAKTEKVGFAQLPLASLWRQCDLIIQNKLVSSGISIHYPYKAVLDHLTEFSSDYVEGDAQCSLFYYDTPYQIDTVSLSDTAAAGTGINSGFYKRSQFSAGSAEVVLEGRLAHDLVFSNCYMPPHLDVKLRLWPSEDKFCLVADSSTTEEYQYKVTECILKMKGIEPTCDLLAKHQALLSTRNAVIHYNRSDIKAFTIPSNVKQWSVSQIWGGPLPYECLVCFVASESYLGSRSKSPFNFGHFNLDYLNLSVEQYQDITFTPDFENKNWVSEYLSLYGQDSGKNFRSGMIKLLDFAGGYSVFKFKLSTAQTIRKNRADNGVGRLTMRWSSNLTSSITLLIYSRHHDKIQMDKSRNIWLTDC